MNLGRPLGWQDGLSFVNCSGEVRMVRIGIRNLESAFECLKAVALA